MTQSSEDLVDLIERRNTLVTKRNALIEEADRLGAEIDVFDRQIQFADAVRVVDSDEMSSGDL